MLGNTIYLDGENLKLTGVISQIVLANGIRTPLDVAILVEHKVTDFVAIGRGSLLDSEWVNKGKRYMKLTPCFRCKACAYRIPGCTCPQKRTGL